MTNMNELEFIHTYCGEMTEQQQIVVENAIQKGWFIGVGHEVGEIKTYLPMILKGDFYYPMVTLPSGHTKVAARAGRHLWDWEKEQKNDG